ncbi:MAG: NAD(+) synthase [Tannerella sp.]|jgi:NAD+ synthase (glutamine-hydrolysing)|nr:NAD(+) synthase [Tannerella sp.]
MNGFVKVAAASPILEVANCTFNIVQIKKLIQKAVKQDVQIITFPELCITGYTCQDLFEQETLLQNAEKALLQLLKNTSTFEIVGLVGLPLANGSKLFNCAVVFQKGQILGVVPKTYLPNYKEFQEMRWFSSGLLSNTDTIKIGERTVPFGTDLLFKDLNNKDLIIGVEICEDLWTPIPPSSLQALKGANIILNPSASNEITGKNQYLKSLIAQQSARCISGYVYACSGFGESTTDLLFSGKGFIAENGSIISESERFTLDNKMVINDIDISYLQHDRYMNKSFAQSNVNKNVRYIPFTLSSHKGKFERYVNAHPFVPKEDVLLKERCEEILHIQTNSLAKRLKHVQCQTAMIGVSGGLDSTLALMVTVRAFDKLNIPRENIFGVTMPGFGTTDRTYRNALKLMESLKVTSKEISIKDACSQHFKDISHDGVTPDVTYENTQARERTQILMDLANMHNGIVIGTGDLSELALGWATYNGDHISMYAVNVSIPKTLVKYLVEWTASNEQDKVTRKTLLDIASTPISPELTPADERGNIKQKTEDIIGPYELHDFFIYHFIRFGANPQKILFLAKQAFGSKYEEETIKKWLRIFLKRFFTQQFKRSCLPDGPKVGSISLSPRCDWRMPSDAVVTEWLEELSIRQKIEVKI